MATFTVTSPANADSLSGKTGGDTYNVNAGVLTVDGHSRFDANGSTSAAMGTITLSATLGGTIKFRADQTRLLAFDTGASTVPAAGTVVSQGGASGKLLGVYANLASAPVTAGSAMPVSGYVLVKQWNGTPYTTGALTGVSASVVADPVFGGTGRDGWIEVVFDESKNLVLNRLNNPNDDVAIGADFYIGITDGNRATSYQIPSNGNRQYIAGVQVETAPGSGEYEWWPVTSSAMTSYNVGTTHERSKVCWIDPINAVIKFGSDGTNSTGGQCPTSGRKVRIPNILMQNAAVASRTVNSFPSTSTRYYFYPLGAGRLRLRNVSSALRVNVWQTAYQVYLRDSSFCGPMLVTQNASPFDIERICVSTPVDDATASNQFGLTSSVSGGTMRDSVVCGGNHAPAAKTALAITGSQSCEFTGTMFTGTGHGTIGTANISIGTSDDILLDDCGVIGLTTLSGSNRVTLTNFFEAAKTTGDPMDGSGNQNFINLSNKCSDILIDNWTFPHDECLPRAALVHTQGCSRVKVRNMGSKAQPINAGGPTVATTYTRSGATATFTKAGHGYRVGDFFYVELVDATSGVSGLRTITSVPDADTFVTNSTNSGATSGSAWGYRTFCSTAASVSASGACSEIEFQNIWVDGAYSNSVGAPGVASDVTALNVSGGRGAAASLASSDMVTRGVRSTLAVPAASSAQYGHTFLDGETLELSPATGTATWTRSGTTMTVTCSGPHNLEVASSRVRLFNCSDAATQPNQWQSARPTSPTTFTCTCVNSGATSGTIDWDVPTDMLTMFMNEESDVTSRYEIDAGTPVFTGAGQFAATSVGDQITWEMPEPLINYTGFAAIPPNSQLTEQLATMGAFHLTYDIAVDDGAFSGTFKNLLLFRGGASGSSGSPVINVSSTTGINVGSNVWGAGVAQGATVLSVDSGTQLTLSLNNTATVSGDLSFGDLPSETFADNFKLKVRLVTLTANSQAITYINIPLTSDATSRARLYPIISVLQTQEVNLVNGIDGSRVQIYDLTSDTELVNDVVTFPFNWTDPDPYVADREIRVRCAYVDGDEAKQFVEAVIGTATNADPVLTYRLNQTDDTVYNLNAVDGSTITGVTINDGTGRYEINKPGGTIPLQDMYAAVMYYRFTETGIAGGTLSLTATDPVNYSLAGKQIKNVSSPSVPLKITGGWITDGDTDDPLDLLDTSGGTVFLAPPHVVPFASGGSLIDENDIAQAVWDRSLTGHTTIGSAGKTLSDTEATTDITQAKVNEL